MCKVVNWGYIHHWDKLCAMGAGGEGGRVARPAAESILRLP